MSAYQRIKAFLFPKTISEKLAEACAKVSGLAKRGSNGEYSYLRIVDIADALRDELFSRGITIIPNDVECVVSKFKSPDPGVRVITEVRVKTEFTVTYGKSSQVYSAYGVGRDMDGKALFAAQTGALKSWLKRLGLIFGERDDPEVEASPKRTPEAEELPKQKAAQLRYQERAWTAALATCGIPEKRVEEILSQALNAVVTSDVIVNLPRADFDVAMQILTRNSDLSEVLEESKKAAAKKRGKAPQPIVAALDHSDPAELAGD
jgi:hypothetical protein